MTNYFRA